MIARIWHGYTEPQQAAAYENLLRTEIFPSIEKKSIPGYLGIQLLKRSLGGEIEFTTIMWFDNLDCVKQFVGEDYATAYVPPSARAILKRFDQSAVHLELIHERQYPE